MRHPRRRRCCDRPGAVTLDGALEADRAPPVAHPPLVEGRRGRPVDEAVDEEHGGPSFLAPLLGRAHERLPHPAAPSRLGHGQGVDVEPSAPQGALQLPPGLGIGRVQVGAAETCQLALELGHEHGAFLRLASQRSFEPLVQACLLGHLEAGLVGVEVMAAAPRPATRHSGPVAGPCEANRDQSFRALASERASPSSWIGGSTLASAASGSLRPEPVSTITVVESRWIRPSWTSRTSSARGATEAGSAKRPSLEASRIWACRISVSLTASMAPPDSSRAEVAPSQDAGLPISIALATVFGFSTGRPRTIGAAPSACAPTMRGSCRLCPAASSSLKPFQ